MSSRWWRRLMRASVAAACLPPAGWTAADDVDPFATPPPKAVRGGGGDATRRAATGAAAVDRARIGQLLKAAERTSGELAEHTRSAFRRGLLPLRDHLEQLALATEIEVLSADAHEVSPAAALQRQVDRLRDVRDRLRAFHQPAAEGWAADTALAEWALADAEQKLARAGGEPVAAQTAEARRREWAAVHYRLRQRDGNIGAASLPSVVHAASLVVGASRSGSERDLLAEEYREQLRRTAALTAEWAERGAGIGRADRVLEARVAVDLEQLSPAGEAAPLADPQPLHDADGKLQELFAAQAEFHRHGTAELYDLARTWLTWRNLHQAAAQTPDLFSKQQTSGRAAALARLQELADQTPDRRGRIAADVTFVRLLAQLDRIDSARAPAAGDRQYLR